MKAYKPCDQTIDDISTIVKNDVITLTKELALQVSFQIGKTLGVELSYKSYISHNYYTHELFTICKPITHN